MKANAICEWVIGTIARVAVTLIPRKHEISAAT